MSERWKQSAFEDNTPFRATRRNPPGQDQLSYRASTFEDSTARMLRQLPIQKVDGADDKTTAPLSGLNIEANDDWTAGLVRSWAATCDVLSFYQERIANEGYLRSATERLSVMHLARGVGYQLRPGLAAQTHLAFTVQELLEANPDPVLVWAGTQVQSVPAIQNLGTTDTQELPQVFETDSDLVAHSAWNRLSPLRQSRSTLSTRLDADATGLLLTGDRSDLQPGDSVLIVGAEPDLPVNLRAWRLVTLKDVQPAGDRTYTQITWHAKPVAASASDSIESAQLFWMRSPETLFGYTPTGVACLLPDQADWAPAGIGLPPVPVLSLAANAGGDLFAGTEQDVFCSTNGGASWQAAPTGSVPKKVCVLTADQGGCLYAATDKGEIHRRDNGGDIWRVMSGEEPRPVPRWLRKWCPLLFRGPLPKSPVHCLLAQNGVLLAGTDEGVYQSADKGRSWQSANLDLPEFDFKTGQSKVAVRDVVCAGNGDFLAATDQGIFRARTLRWWPAILFGLLVMLPFMLGPKLTLGETYVGIYKSVFERWRELNEGLVTTLLSDQKLLEGDVSWWMQGCVGALPFIQAVLAFLALRLATGRVHAFVQGWKTKSLGRIRALELDSRRRVYAATEKGLFRNPSSRIRRWQPACLPDGVDVDVECMCRYEDHVLLGTSSGQVVHYDGDSAPTLDDSRLASVGHIIEVQDGLYAAGKPAVGAAETKWSPFHVRANDWRLKPSNGTLPTDGWAVAVAADQVHPSPKNPRPKNRSVEHPSVLVKINAALPKSSDDFVQHGPQTALDVDPGDHTAQNRSAVYQFDLNATDSQLTSGHGLPGGPIHQLIDDGQGGLIAATNRDVFRSDNAGETWRSVPTAEPRNRITALALDIGGQWLAASDQGQRYVSNDQGESWQVLGGQQTWRMVLARPWLGGNLPATPIRDWWVQDRGGRSTQVVATDAGVFLSKNGGKTWRTCRLGMPKVNSWPWSSNVPARALAPIESGEGATMHVAINTGSRALPIQFSGPRVTLMSHRYWALVITLVLLICGAMLLRSNIRRNEVNRLDFAVLIADHQNTIKRNQQKIDRIQRIRDLGEYPVYLSFLDQFQKIEFSFETAREFEDAFFEKREFQIPEGLATVVGDAGLHQKFAALDIEHNLEPQQVQEHRKFILGVGPKRKKLLDHIHWTEDKIREGEGKQNENRRKLSRMQASHRDLSSKSVELNRGISDFVASIKVKWGVPGAFVTDENKRIFMDVFRQKLASAIASGNKSARHAITGIFGEDLFFWEVQIPKKYPEAYRAIQQAKLGQEQISKEAGDITKLLKIISRDLNNLRNRRSAENQQLASWRANELVTAWKHFGELVDMPNRRGLRQDLEEIGLSPGSRIEDTLRSLRSESEDLERDQIERRAEIEAVHSHWAAQDESWWDGLGHSAVQGLSDRSLLQMLDGAIKTSGGLVLIFAAMALIRLITRTLKIPGLRTPWVWRLRLRTWLTYSILLASIAWLGGYLVFYGTATHSPPTSLVTLGVLIAMTGLLALLIALVVSQWLSVIHRWRGLRKIPSVLKTDSAGQLYAGTDQGVYRLRPRASVPGISRWARGWAWLVDRCWLPGWKPVHQGVDIKSLGEILVDGADAPVMVAGTGDGQLLQYREQAWETWLVQKQPTSIRHLVGNRQSLFWTEFSKVSEEDAHWPPYRGLDRTTTNVVTGNQLLPIYAPQPVSGSRIRLKAVDPPPRAGRPLVVMGKTLAGRDHRREVAIVQQTESDAGGITVTLNQDLQEQYDPEAVTILGNVVTATHGQTVREELLGVSDGSANQRFSLQQTPLTYVSDASASGAASMLTVRVNGVVWPQIQHLDHAGPHDRGYQIQRDAAERASIQFGDGTNGARLPGMRSQVTATYRVGLWACGNVLADSLTQVVSGAAGVEAVTNPIGATGGTDPDSVLQAKMRVPLHTRKPARIVSLSDYEDFGRTFPGIGKAKVSLFRQAHGRLLHLTVAAENGSDLDRSAPLLEKLIRAIDRARAHPDPALSVASYQAVYFRIIATLVLRPDHRLRRDAIKREVRQKLWGHFRFRNRDLGRNVSASEVVRLIQPIRGIVAVELDGLQQANQSGSSNLLTAQLARHADDNTVLPAELLLLRDDRSNSIQLKSRVAT